MIEYVKQQLPICKAITTKEHSGTPSSFKEVEAIYDKLSADTSVSVVTTSVHLRAHRLFVGVFQRQRRVPL